MNLLTLSRQYLAYNTGLRKPGTMQHYRAALDLFVEWCPTLPEARAEQVGLLVEFAKYALTSPGRYGRRRSAATAKLYTGTVKGFLRWCIRRGYLELPFEDMLDELETAYKSTIFKYEQLPKDAPPGIDKLLAYYIATPSAIITEDYHEKELIRLRNLALVRTLADSGGRVSEVLSLTTKDFPLIAFESTARGALWTVWVTGKRGHKYRLWLRESCHFIAEYMEARGVDSNKTQPLFVHFGGTYRGESLNGKTLSRQSALYIVHKAAKALGIGNVTPHQLRHYRAVQLVNEGKGIDIIQEVLGHTSIETTRKFYARTTDERIERELSNARHNSKTRRRMSDL